MKANFLLVVVVVSSLAGCTAAEQSETLTTEKEAISRVKQDAATTVTKAKEHYQELKKTTLTGVKTLREGAVEGAAAVSTETENGARALEEGAKGLEKWSHKAAQHAAAISEAARSLHPEAKKRDNNNADSTPAEAAH